MAMEFGSTKKNRCWMSGLPMDNPLSLFWDCKNSPSLYEMDHKYPCVVCMNCVEIVFSSSKLNLMLLIKIE